MSLLALLQTRMFWATVPRVFYWGLGMVLLVFVLLWMTKSRGDALDALRADLQDMNRQIEAQQKALDAAAQYINTWSTINERANTKRAELRQAGPQADLRQSFADVVRMLNDKGYQAVPPAPGASHAEAGAHLLGSGTKGGQ